VPPPGPRRRETPGRWRRGSPRSADAAGAGRRAARPRYRAPAGRRAGSRDLLLGAEEGGAGAVVVGIGDHETALNGADAPFDDARVAVKHDGGDAGIGENRLQPGQPDGIVGSCKFLHWPAIGFRYKLKCEGRGLDPRREPSMLAIA